MTEAEGEGIVERVVERAAEKAANAATPILAPTTLTRIEAFVAITCLVLLNLAALFLSLQNRNESRARAENFRVICQIITTQQPTPDVVKVAKCLE